jgi:choline/glycine/proline betaine transport protein
MTDAQSYLQKHTNPPVFIVSLLLVVVFVLWGIVAPGNLGDVATAVKDGFIGKYLGWWYLAAVFGFLVFTVIVLFSPYGRLRLGKDHETPEWKTWSWFSMLFTAGMGIGLVFFGVMEPVWHYMGPPGGEVEARTGEAAVLAMHQTYFHWGFHPWAVYIILGMSMGYFCFRHDLPLRPASAFYPLIGRGIYGWVGNLIDILAVFGTLFGLATSLGLGATQISAGVNSVFGVPDGITLQVIVIGVVTAAAVTSVMLGLDGGIRRLSVWNMYGAIILAALVFLAGPTLFILKFLVQSVGYYLQNLPATSLNIFAFGGASGEGGGWMISWTLFYWGWWIAWSPFVGMFIARVSRGRTIRQFILGCLIAPVGASMVWFAIFGGSAIHYMREGLGSAIAGAGTSDGMFKLLSVMAEHSFLPGIITTLMAILTIIVVATFFATSSDSGSLVVDMLTNGGDPNPDWRQRLFWATTEGAVAAILLIGGAAAADDPTQALNALQAASVAGGLPFSIVLALMCWGLTRQFRQDVVPAPTGAAQVGSGAHS